MWHGHNDDKKLNKLVPLFMNKKSIIVLNNDFGPLNKKIEHGLMENSSIVVSWHDNVQSLIIPENNERIVI
jgi:hypothetical protein